MDVTCLFR